GRRSSPARTVLPSASRPACQPEDCCWTAARSTTRKHTRRPQSAGISSSYFPVSFSEIGPLPLWLPDQAVGGQRRRALAVAPPLLAVQRPTAVPDTLPRNSTKIVFGNSAVFGISLDVPATPR